MKPISIFSIIFIVCRSVFGQGVVYGPIIGGVTENSAGIFVRTTSLDSIKIELYTDTLTGPVATFHSLSLALLDTSNTVQLTSLQPATDYHFKVFVDNLPLGEWCSFSTFPAPGTSTDFSFGFGSCIRDPLDDSIFLEAAHHDLSFFLILGDWGYHDQTTQFPAQTDFFCTDYEDVVKTYHEKYSGINQRGLMRNLPFDYVYDNHDYMWTYSTRDSTTYIDLQNKTFTEHANPPGCRANSISAYYNLFPHYTPVDSVDGIYHSFKHGNAEIFMIDNRESRSPLSHAFQLGAFGLWEFNPRAGYRMLGQKQFNWLVNGLKDSDATWKFIVTGVPFNKKYGDFMDVALTLQDVTIPNIGSGFEAAAGIALSSWAGFPTDQDSLLTIIEEHNIKNVIALSGDSHTSAIDDGLNAGITEMNSGNLAKENSQVASLAQSVGIELWNSGGQGLGNNNFNEAFGKVNVFGEDSVVLRIVDLYGQVVASHTVLNTETVNFSSSNIESKKPVVFTYPNPANDYCWILTNVPDMDFSVSVLSAEGKLVETLNYQHSNIPNKLNLETLGSGTYFLEFSFEKNHISKSLVVLRNVK